MRVTCIVALGAIALLAGCGPTAEQQAVMDHQRCASFGFAPGTDAFANCLMKTTQHREAQSAADRRAWEAQTAADRRAKDAAQAAKDQADRDAWDRRTHQGAYASGVPTVSKPAQTLKPIAAKCTTDTKTVGNTTYSHQECHS